MKLNIPVHKNEEYPAKVVDLSYEGNGVVKIDDFPVFVPNALPGEEITVKITKVTSHFAWGRVMDWQRISRCPLVVTTTAMAGQASMLI